MPGVTKYVDEGERDILSNELEARRTFRIVILVFNADYNRR
jgi:hypothetical protein